MKQLFIRRWFVALLILVLAAGLMWPYSLAPAASFVPEWLLLPSVLLAMALPLELRRMWQAVQRPTAALLGVAMNSLFVPLLAWGLAFALPAELAAGLMLTAAVPCTLASAAVWTRRAGGDDTVALLVMLATNLSCFLVTPLWLAWTMGRSVRIEAGPLIYKLALLVTLPIVIAQAARSYRPLARLATRHSTALGVVAQVGILLMVFGAATQAGDKLRQPAAQALGAAHWLTMLTAVFLLHALSLGVAVAVGRALRLARADWIAVGFSGSQKTLMVGLVISSEIGSLALLPMIAYHFCQLLLDTLVADRLRGTL